MNDTYEFITKFINWNKTTKIDSMKLALMLNFSKEELEEAEHYAGILIGRLRDAGIEQSIAEYNGYYGDSVHDCMCELVAHGEEYVDHVIANPEIALNRFKNNDYTENFLYCFPNDMPGMSDYDLMTAVHYWREVCELKRVFRLFLHGTDKATVTRWENGKTLENRLTHEQVKMIADVLDEIWNLKWNSNRDYDTIYKNSEGMGHGAWLANVWYDFGRFYARIHPESVIGDGKYRKNPDKISK